VEDPSISSARIACIASPGSGFDDFIRESRHIRGTRGNLPVHKLIVQTKTRGGALRKLCERTASAAGKRTSTSSRSLRPTGCGTTGRRLKGRLCPTTPNQIALGVFRTSRPIKCRPRNFARHHWVRIRVKFLQQRQPMPSQGAMRLR